MQQQIDFKKIEDLQRENKAMALFLLKEIDPDAYSKIQEKIGGGEKTKFYKDKKV